MLDFLPLFLVFAVLLVRPFLQRQREKDVADRLKKTRDPHEAMLIVDNMTRLSRRDGHFFAWLRESFFFWL